MKQCPRCQRNYDDDQLNFCLDDGEMLILMARPQTRYADAQPPTVLLDQSRVTNPSNWPASPPAQWQQAAMQQTPQQYLVNRSPDQTLAVVSLCFGIASITVGWCCSSGILFSLVALITGFMALSKLKKDPQRYGGRGMAIGGIVTGIIYFAVIALFILIYGLAIIGSGISSLK